MFQIGVGYVNAGDAISAVPYLKAAFEEAPQYSDARILYAAGLMYAGQNAIADALLTDGFGTVLVDDSRLLQVYTTTRQTERVIGIWKVRVAKNPNDIQTHVGLAQAYFVTGNKAAAIAELQNIAHMSPSLAPQVEATVKQIQDGTIK